MKIKNFVIASLIGSFTVPAAGSTPHEPSTADWEFLVGDWDVERTYRPGSEEERTQEGTLTCNRAVLDAYIRCLFDFDRPDRGPSRDDVFYNYNDEYGRYESMWLSSTWPIKVVMSGDMDVSARTLAAASQFPLAGDMIEYVRSTYRWNDDSIVRETHIRTSEDPEDDWTFHMVETSTRRSAQ